MSFRITTNMMMNSYRYNLQGSTKKLSDARDMVLTQRNFNSYAEDPAAATQEFRLRRDYYNTYSQVNNTKNVYSKYNTAWNNLTGLVENLSDATARVASIRGNNGGTGEARSALAIVLRETSESVIHAMNQKLGDQFIFAGNDGLNVPFEWKTGADGVKQLYYRGINVDAGSVKKPTAEEPTWLDEWKDSIDTLTQTAEADKAESERALAWYNYYTHQTDVKPSDPDSSDGSNPYLDVLMPQNSITTEEAAWKDYYAHKADKPESNEPDQLHNWKPAIDGLAQKAANEQAESESKLSWYNYYNHDTDARPEKPVGGYMDELLKGQSLTALNDKEQEWVKYYQHRAEKPVADEPAWATPADKNGIPENMPAVGKDDVEKGWIAYYNDQADAAKLAEMADEQLYIDLGMGLAEKSANNAVNGSYFNSALCGVDFVGYGRDADGDPKNLATIMRELADVFQAWDEDVTPQGYNPDLAGPTAKDLTSDELEAKAFRLMDKLKAAQEHTTEKWDELDAQSVFLTTNQERLETQLTDTNSQILDISQVDLADAITNFSWQQYCYNSALKIGNQLLSQSLIDYMR